MKNVPNLKSILAVVGGVGAGLGLMYLFDPKNGAERRAAIRERAEGIRDRAVEVSSDVRQSVYSTGSELRARAQEVVNDAVAMIPLVNTSANAPQPTPIRHRIKASAQSAPRPGRVH